MVKPPCISCGRKVGTLFTHVNGNYRAICGDHLSNQCKLDIHIISGNFSRFDGLFTLYNEDIQDNKQTIIEQKMNTLFKYISEETSAKQFKEELEQYNSTSDMYKRLLDKYDDVNCDAILGTYRVILVYIGIKQRIGPQILKPNNVLQSA